MMEQTELYRNCVELIKEGKAPADVTVLKELSTGLSTLTDFLKERYLIDYIAGGGSKIKLVTGRPGSGKTHLANLLSAEAENLNYITVHFSAKQIWLNDFREIYLEVLRQCDIEAVLEHCARQIIHELGYDPADIREGQCFLDYLSEIGNADPLAKSAIRTSLREKFTRNPVLDNNFASCCSLLTGGILGHPKLEPSSKELLLAFMSGDKTVKLSQLRALGLSPARVTKFNARNLLRSLAEVIHLGGFRGLFIVIDDMEMLLNRSSGDAIRYTKLRRDDTYESIRQLIDDIDNMRYIMFTLCFDRELMDNDSYGIKSYQALWLRIQNEIVSPRFNKFADIIDMDRYADECYSPDILFEMSTRLYSFFIQNDIPAREISAEEILELKDRANFGGLGLPFIINRAVAERGKENV